MADFMLTMYVRGFPKYYVKDGERRAVYYTAEVRDLVSFGWVAEDTINKKITTQSKKEETAAPSDVVATEEKEPNFDFMTKTELLQYALDRGVDLPNNSTKAQLVDACRGL